LAAENTTCTVDDGIPQKQRHNMLTSIAGGVAIAMGVLCIVDDQAKVHLGVSEHLNRIYAILQRGRRV
jgi:hypothetical protein